MGETKANHINRSKNGAGRGQTGAVYQDGESLDLLGPRWERPDIWMHPIFADGKRGKMGVCGTAQANLAFGGFSWPSARLEADGQTIQVTMDKKRTKMDKLSGAFHFSGVETYHKSATQKPKSLILLYTLVNQRGLHCHYALHNFTIKILMCTSKMTRFQRKSRPEGRLSCGLLDVFDDVPDRLG